MIISKRKSFKSDPFLSELLETDEETAAFENLCKFYVGMTRPAWYLFSKPPSPNSKSKNFIYLLNDTLSVEMRNHGDNRWLEREGVILNWHIDTGGFISGRL